jgi:PTS system nitrogen regulatory IIA component
MKLTVQEAAKLLNTTERSIYRWIKQSAIPCQSVNDNYRFHRAELLEWATARGLSVSVDAFPPSRRIVDNSAPGFATALRAGGIYHDVEGSDRESALRAIVSRIPLASETDREFLFDVLLAREAMGSTGVGDGIAIPHVRSPVVLPANQPAVTLCFLARPVDFHAIDDRPVHTFFSLVTLTIRSHLYLLSRLSAALQDPRFKQAVVDRASPEEILTEAVRVDRASGADPEDVTK